MQRPTAEHLRAELQHVWDEVITGTRSRAAAADWACESDRALDYSSSHVEPLHQGWYRMHDLRQAPLDEAAATSGGPRDRDELAARWCRQWQEEVTRYDADPLTWNRTYWGGYLRGIVERGHVRNPRRLADQLIKNGLILEEDATAVLGNGPTGAV